MKTILSIILAGVAITASPVISASYENGYLGEGLAAVGIITQETAPSCRATVSEGEDALAIYASGTFREMQQYGEGREAWFCLN